MGSGSLGKQGKGRTGPRLYFLILRIEDRVFVCKKVIKSLGLEQHGIGSSVILLQLHSRNLTKI